jgi:hypothetical protein
MIVKLKWTKVDWQKDLQVGGTWKHPNPSAPRDIGVLLDNVHKTFGVKKEKKTKALEELEVILEAYVDSVKGTPAHETIIEKRLGQVLKARKRYDLEGKYATKLNLELILKVRMLREALMDFVVANHSEENLLFILAVDNQRPAAEIQGFLEPLGAGYQSATGGGQVKINISDAGLKDAWEGRYEKARADVMAQLTQDTIPKFKKSPQLAAALDAMSVIP